MATGKTGTLLLVELKGAHPPKKEGKRKQPTGCLERTNANWHASSQEVLVARTLEREGSALAVSHREPFLIARSAHVVRWSPRTCKMYFHSVAMGKAGKLGRWHARPRYLTVLGIDLASPEHAHSCKLAERSHAVLSRICTPFLTKAEHESAANCSFPCCASFLLSGNHLRLPMVEQVLAPLSPL